MKQIKALLLVGLVYGLCQNNLLSKSLGVLEGIVTDKDTGIPIEGALVSVIPFPELWLNHLESRTDEKGRFEFRVDNVEQDYYIECEKEGYIPRFPIYYKWELQCYHPETLRKFLNIFSLKTGEAKHLDIHLEKGGTLQGKIFKKDTRGISPYAGIAIILYRDRVDSDNSIFPSQIKKVCLNRNNFILTDKNGEFTIANLEPLIYDIKIIFWDWPQSELKNIKIKKCEIQSIEYVKDLMDPTGIKGTIRVNNTIPLFAAISFQIVGNGEADRINLGYNNTYNNGDYSCPGLPPGSFHMFVFCKDVNGIDFEKKIDIKILSGKTSVLNINLNKSDKRKMEDADENDT